MSSSSNNASATRPPSDLDAPNHYEVLGVPFDATPQQITRAYREAMKQIHPDRASEAARDAAEEQAKLINVAYATLASPTKREAYNREIRAQTIQDQLMRAYVGGVSPLDQYSTDMTGERFRREPTAHQRRDRSMANRTAIGTMLLTFAGFALMLIVVAVLWGVVTSVLGR